jgi:pyruvate dehydrogenase E1 component beta subunit
MEGAGPAICGEAARTGRLLAVDEDYQGFGLSGELSAVVLEAGISCRFARVCTQETIPYARSLEDAVLPNKKRICAAARELMES